MTDTTDWFISGMEMFSKDSRARAWVIGCSDPIAKGYVSRYKWGVTLECVIWNEGWDVDPTSAQRKAETAMQEALTTGWPKETQEEG